MCLRRSAVWGALIWGTEGREFKSPQPDKQCAGQAVFLESAVWPVVELGGIFADIKGHNFAPIFKKKTDYPSSKASHRPSNQIRYPHSYALIYQRADSIDGRNQYITCIQVFGGCPAKSYPGRGPGEDQISRPQLANAG